MDGVPQLTQPAVAPGASFDYRFRPPDAGTFWYHAYIAGQTDRGLAGAFIVEDAQPVDVDSEIALLLTTPAAADGPPVLVNGSVRPDIAVKPGERLRLRIINATTARGLFIRLDGHAVRVMAIDGQPAEPFLARDGRVGLGPGNRIDLFIDTMGDAGATAPLLAAPLTDAREERPIARLVYERGGAARRRPIGAAAAQSAPGAYRSAKLAQGRTPACERQGARPGRAAAVYRQARAGGHACDPQQQQPSARHAPARP
jgi:FtsP/CotA-like multicopper oxidase with cupredoxin domain